MDLNELARSLRTVGDERRLHIICHLMRNGETSVSEIAVTLRMSVATTSHHLQVMTRDGIVIAHRDGKRICYQLPDTKVIVQLRRFILSQTDL